MVLNIRSSSKRSKCKWLRVNTGNSVVIQCENRLLLSLPPSFHDDPFLKFRNYIEGSWNFPNIIIAFNISRSLYALGKVSAWITLTATGDNNSPSNSLLFLLAFSQLINQYKTMVLLRCLESWDTRGDHRNNTSNGTRESDFSWHLLFSVMNNSVWSSWFAFCSDFVWIVF